VIKDRSARSGLGKLAIGSLFILMAFDQSAYAIYTALVVGAGFILFGLFELGKYRQQLVVERQRGFEVKLTDQQSVKKVEKERD